MSGSSSGGIGASDPKDHFPICITATQKTYYARVIKDAAGGFVSGTYLDENNAVQTLAAGSFTYGACSTGATAQNIDYDIGNISFFPSAGPPSDAFIALSGGTFPKSDYPLLWTKITSGALGGFTAGANDFTVPNLNTGAAGGAGYFLGGLGGAAPGALDADATAVNGLSMGGAIAVGVTSPSTGATAPGERGLIRVSGLATTSPNPSQFIVAGGLPDLSGNPVNHTHAISSVETETRPHTYRGLWVVKAKPTPTILQTGSTLNILSGVKKFATVQPLAIGSNTITHNLNLASPFAMVEVRHDTTSEIVTHLAFSYTAMTMIIQLQVAVNPARIIIIG